MNRTDARILRLLEANGRMSYQEMAEVVGLSANAVRARAQALFAHQVIRGIHADVDWGGGGVKIEALIDPVAARSGRCGVRASGGATAGCRRARSPRGTDPLLSASIRADDGRT